MAAKFDSYSNSWLQKTVNFHLNLVGLGDNQALSKYVPWSHCVMLTLFFTCIFQQLLGIGYHISNGDATMARILILFELVVILCICIEEPYSLVYRKAVAKKCLRHAATTLHCLSYVEEATVREKHVPLFKILMMNGVLIFYFALFINCFISPLVRFGLNLGSEPFLLYPIWYPFDIFSSKYLICAALIYEWLLFASIIHSFVTRYNLLVYIFFLAQVRFDALRHFIRDIPLVGGQRLSSHEKWRLKDDAPLETSILIGQSLTLEAADTSGSCRRLSTFLFDSDYEGLVRLRKAAEDLHMLRRHVQFMNETFKVAITVCHSAGFPSCVMMTFAVAYILRDASVKHISVGIEIYVFAVIDVVGLLQVYIFCYMATLLQESHETLRITLYGIEWYTEKPKLKRLFMLAKSVLNRPLTMKAYAFYPMNLVTFNSSLKEAWGVMLFLFNLTAPRT